jgi:hypothetical protein
MKVATKKTATKDKLNRAEERRQERFRIYVCGLCSKYLEETAVAEKHLAKYHKVNWRLIEEQYHHMKSLLIQAYVNPKGYEEENLKKWK